MDLASNGSKIIALLCVPPTKFLPLGLMGIVGLSVEFDDMGYRYRAIINILEKSLVIKDSQSLLME